MTQKIKFQVVYATGSDDEYSSSSLESHGPSVKGWRSERFCVYPQELVLQLPSVIRVRKLQILSHQYLIARKIELYIGTCRPGTVPSYQSASFSRLGYISFDANEKTTFKARELKSVHLDCEGVYVKLVCQKNHVNKLNIFNQVGVVAVNILGEFSSQDKPQSYRDIALANNENSDPVVMGRINRPDHMSMIDDITFGMYQDPEVARVIQQLERKKHVAIEEERYDYAKRLKQAIGDLYKVGEKLGRLEQEKKAAVAEENYDLAQAKKVQANEIRVVVFEQLNIQALLQSDRLKTDDTPNVLVRSPPRQLPALAAQQDNNQPETVPQYSQPAPFAPPPEPISPPIDSNERPIPTLANNNKPPPQEEEEVPATADPDGPDEYSIKQAHDLTQAVDMFGLPTVACLFCKQFALRERGMNEISQALQDLDTTSPTYSARALVQVFKQAFADPVFNTFSQTLDNFKYLIQTEKLTKSHTIELCSGTLPVLLKRVGENARNKAAIDSLFLDLCDTTYLSKSNCIPNLTVSPCKEKNPKVLTGRLVLLEHLLEKLGVDDNTYTVDLVMKFIAPTLSNTARDVRDTAIRITLYMYRSCGDPVRKFLPKDEPILRKKQLIWKKIFESFDEIDGKPVHKANEPSAEERKAQQVAALKAELASLRELAAGSNIEIPEELKPGNEHMKINPKKKKKKPGAAAGGAAAAETPAPVEEEEDEPAADADPDDNLDKTCMFCNEHNDKFNAETLDVHFWRSCPMLSRCNHCSQVVEIAGTTTHLLTECTAQDNFEQCKSCQLAKSSTAPHACTTVPESGETLCPLCTDGVRDGEEGWREHLMGPGGCSKNPRRD